MITKLSPIVRGAFPFLLVTALTAVSPFSTHAGPSEPGGKNWPDRYNVTWDVPGPTSSQSMPIGNGDIGLNVWVETNGDACFYIGKTDSWGDDVYSDDRALLKLGKVRISPGKAFTTNTSFSQTLDLPNSEIRISEGAGADAVEMRVWVDANHPVIRVEVKSSTPATTKVTMEDWRAPSKEDMLLDNQTNRIAWYHRNSSGANPHIANLTSGAIIEGTGFVSKDASTLESAKPAKSQLIFICPLVATTPTADAWVTQLASQAAELGRLKLERTRTEHQKWWNQFWHRSWINVEGDQAAADSTRGYVLQRFVTACAGRGAYPIKFNGSIFVVDNPTLDQGRDRPPRSVNADHRSWGGQYWFQNTRAMYWPRLEAGDFDMMLPLFKMYAATIPNNSALVQKYYHHDGAYFAETAPFWGGMSYVGPEVKENYTAHYFTPILEISMMMLDYYEYTGDKQFAADTLVPVATAGLEFFDKHFKRDDQGKLLLDPDNSIEMYWKVHNPAPDIAGLHAILTRMIALPDSLVSNAAHENWTRFLHELPELPTGTNNHHEVLLPYTGPQTAQQRNGENPELYAVYPFRLYGLDKPDLQLARDTFAARRCTQKGCWVQDPIQAAMLGLADVAKTYTHFDLTRREPHLKFPAFWAKANDYDPDEDNGGNGENGLQQMLLQADGDKILLLPAWPKGWNADFKLNAPHQTTVQAKVRDGHLLDVVVTPSSRKNDIVDLSVQHVSVNTHN